MFSCKLGYYGNHALLNQSNYSIWDSYDLNVCGSWATWCGSCPGLATTV